MLDHSTCMLGLRDWEGGGCDDDKEHLSCQSVLWKIVTQVVSESKVALGAFSKEQIDWVVSKLKLVPLMKSRGQPLPCLCSHHARWNDKSEGNEVVGDVAFSQPEHLDILFHGEEPVVIFVCLLKCWRFSMFEFSIFYTCSNILSVLVNYSHTSVDLKNLSSGRRLSSCQFPFVP